jgi:hypothetical protein
MNRLFLGLLAIAGAGLWLLTGSNVHSAPQRASSAPQYLEGDATKRLELFHPR